MSIGSTDEQTTNSNDKLNFYHREKELLGAERHKKDPGESSVEPESPTPNSSDNKKVRLKAEDIILEYLERVITCLKSVNENYLTQL